MPSLNHGAYSPFRFASLSFAARASLVAVVSLAACSAERPAGPVASPDAEIVINEWIDYKSLLKSPCISEQVTVTGKMHTIISVVKNRNGIRVLAENNFASLSGVGESGTQYVVTEALVKVDGTADEAADVATVWSNQNVVSLDGSDNFRVQALVHITTLADGTLAAVVEDYTATCEL